MKIKKIQTFKNKLLTLKLIKFKVYKENTLLKKYRSNPVLRINDIEFNLKKILKILYKYHIKNKRLLFIGVPLILEKKIKYLLKNSRHIFMSNSIWINSILLNKHSCFKYLKKQKIKKELNDKKTRENLNIFDVLFELRRKADMVIIFNPATDYLALEESYKTRIPILTLSNQISKKITYNLPGNFQFSRKTLKNNIFFSMLLSTFKKAQNCKSTYSNLKKERTKNIKHEISIQKVNKIKRKYSKS